jgi:hypothetical protein
MDGRAWVGFVVGIVIAGTSGSASADAPWKRMNLFKHVEADPDADYTVTDQNGPWMIMAATFAGKGGHEQARALVLQLRKEFKLPAYVHQKTFDYSDTVNGIGVDKYNRPKKMKHQRDVKAEEIAVLVGNYPAVDDAQAQRDLDKVKQIYPDALRPNQAGRSNQQLAWWHNLQRRVARMNGSQERKGPMGRAFVTTNPLLPPQFFASRGVDRMVEDMNRGVKHSLLDCKGKYSVLVATFKGNVIIDQSKIERIERGEIDPKNDLVAAAEKAHKVCEALREKGYEAYEFHDRAASLVTVGSFDSLGTPRPDGKTEINPAIYKIMQTFAGADMQLPGNLTYQNMNYPVLGRKPKRLEGIPLDVQPMPVMAPKRSGFALGMRDRN